MINKQLYFFLCFVLFVLFANIKTNAQIKNKDSVLGVIKTKRITDSLVRIELKNKLQYQRDSLKLAIKTKRVVDSLNRISIVQQRINERKQQDSILAYKKKFIADSVEAAKNGITIRLADIEKEKSEEKIRIKKLEEKIAKQQIEDSIFLSLKLIKETVEKRKQDSIALDIKKQDEIKQKAIIAEQKRIADSTSLAKQIEQEKQRILQEKIIAHEKRISDSILLAKQFDEEKQRILQERILAQEKLISDSIYHIKQIEEEKIKLEKEKLFILQKHFNDSLKMAQDSILNVNKIAQEKLFKEQKLFNDSLKNAQKIEENKNKLLFAQLSAKQKRYYDSLQIMQELERQKRNSIQAKYYSTTDTSNLDKIILLKIKDSLETIERIRLQELKYTKQRTEDSLYLISLQKIDTIQDVRIAILIDSTKTKIDTINTINEIAKTDSIKTKLNSIKLVPKTGYLKKAIYFSINFGISNYLGDLGGNSGVGKKFFYDNNFKKRTYMYGTSISKIWREAIGIRMAINLGKIAGSDNDVEYKDKNDNAYFRYKRNLDFSTKITEYSAIIEFFPLKFFNKKSLVFKSSFQPYGLLGIGNFTFNPQGSFYDEISQDYILVDLAPLRTEGQGMVEYPGRTPYKLNQINLPFGAGIKYDLGVNTSLSFEFLGRKLFTDYLDDVSTTYVNSDYYNNYFNGEDLEIAKTMTNKSNMIDPDMPFNAGEVRGNPKYNDFYYSFNFKLSIKISKNK